MEIYVTDIQNLMKEPIFERMLAFVPQERKDKIQSYRNDADKCRILAAGLLLEYGLSHYDYSLLTEKKGKKTVSLAQGEYGKPYLLEETEISFNLSHSGNYAAAIFGFLQVGIDIEKKRSKKEAVARRFFHSQEYEYLLSMEENLQEMCFTKIWSRKESYVKAIGKGLHLKLTDFCVCEDTVEKNGLWHLKSFEQIAGYALSVCAKEEINAEPQFVDFLKIEEELRCNME